ncbi:MAG: hypothetical protein IJV74_06530 [Clostridia bacterium]|nr:hypothetical protein [Clostridia bacterium]
MPRIKRNRSDVLASGNYYPLRKDFIKVLGLRGTAAILFTVIYSYSLNDDLQGSFYGSRQMLAEEVGVSTRALDRYIKIMLDDGLIEKCIINRDNQWTPTYRVNIEAIEQRIEKEIEAKYKDVK